VALVDVVEVVDVVVAGCAGTGADQVSGAADRRRGGVRDGMRKPAGSHDGMPRGVEGEHAIGRRAAGRPAEHVDRAPQGNGRRVFEGMAKVGDDTRGARARVNLLNRIARPARRRLAPEQVDRSPCDRRRRVADRDGEGSDRLEGASVGRREHGRIRSRPVIAAEYVRAVTDRDRDEVRPGLGETAGALCGAAV
jgi:hypothetical protein